MLIPYTAGWHAAKEGRPVTDNPFKGEAARQAFINGYNEYLKKLQEAKR